MYKQKKGLFNHVMNDLTNHKDIQQGIILLLDDDKIIETIKEEINISID